MWTEHSPSRRSTLDALVSMLEQRELRLIATSERSSPVSVMLFVEYHLLTLDRLQTARCATIVDLDSSEGATMPHQAFFQRTLVFGPLISHWDRSTRDRTFSSFPQLDSRRSMGKCDNVIYFLAIVMIMDSNLIEIQLLTTIFLAM